MYLKDIVIDAGTQARDLISENTVSDYTEALLEGAVFPPIEVFDDGLKKYLVDGFHRYFMYQRAKITEVEVIVHKGTLRDAQYYSKCVNREHGLPRTPATKRKIVTDVLADLEWQDFSDRKLAKDLGVSHTFIQKMRKELDKPQQSDRKPKPKPKKVEVPEVEVLKPLEEMITEDDRVKELAELNEELHEENLKLKDREMIVEGKDVQTLETIEELRKRVKILEMENRSIKNSRDQLQSKNAELVKTVNYWKKKYEKLSKAD